jgi:hypothetical protein
VAQVSKAAVLCEIIKKLLHYDVPSTLWAGPPCTVEDLDTKPDSKYSRKGSDNMKSFGMSCYWQELSNKHTSMCGALENIT